MVYLAFLPGSTDQVEKCTHINATADDLIECDEEFKVVLALSTPGVSLSLGNNITAVTLIDGDGMLPASFSPSLLESNFIILRSCYIFSGCHGNCS